MNQRQFNRLSVPQLHAIFFIIVVFNGLVAVRVMKVKGGDESLECPYPWWGRLLLSITPLWYPYRYPYFVELKSSPS